MEKQHFVVYTMGIFVVFMVVNIRLIQNYIRAQECTTNCVQLCSTIL